MKTVRISSIAIGFLGFFGLITSLFAHMPFIILYPSGWEGIIIRIFEWIGFITLIIAGISSFGECKYHTGITNIFADISFLTLVSIIFVGIVTFSWSFLTLIPYIIPCILAVILIFDTALIDLKN